MKKYFVLVILCICLTSIKCFADFSNEAVDYEFDRGRAYEYMTRYCKNYNPLFFDFSEYGGDCTNFASQIVSYAGVTFTQRTNTQTYKDWYYYGPDWGYDRTSTWTGATEFRKHFGDVLGEGKKRARKMTTYTVNEAIENFDKIWRDVKTGDIISHGHTIDTSYHSQIVYDFPVFRKDILVAQHTDDYLDRSFLSYLKYRKRIGQGREYIFVIEM